jgi:hypothetical protein
MKTMVQPANYIFPGFIFNFDVMAKLMLDMDAMSKDFFEDCAMIGIAAAQPGYRFCWLVNNYFDISFVRDPAQNIYLQKKDKEKKENEYQFAVYQYDLPDSDHKYLLYKLKDGSESLLPETKQMDYLWLIQTANPEEDAYRIARELRNIPDVQLAQILTPEQLKNLNNLLV